MPSRTTCPRRHSPGSLLLVPPAHLNALTVRAVNIGSGATLGIDGTITGPVTNAGTVQAFGNPTIVTGDYTQTARGVLDVPFKSTLAMPGKATLAGALQTGGTPKAPPPGSRATLLTFGSHQGTFTSHSLGFKVITLATRIDAVAQPQIVAPSNAPAGGRVTVSGGDFQDPSVKIFLDSTSGTPLGRVQPSFNGTFQKTVTIPAGTSAGSHMLIATGSAGSSARRAIQVTAGR